MLLIEIIIAMLTAVGLIFILADIYKIPYLKTSRALIAAGKKQIKKNVIKEEAIYFFMKFIKTSKYKRERLAADLKSADINTTPEHHIANAVVKAIPAFILAIPFMWVFPLISPVMFCLSLAVFFNEKNSVQKTIRERRRKIEFELLGFVNMINRTLTHTRDVLYMIEKYSISCCPELKSELDITLAEMKSGNYEASLKHLEQRVGSVLMSDVTKGLISIINGDDNAFYWQNLIIKFQDAQRTTLKEQAVKIPGKIRRLNAVILLCFMVVFFVVIIMLIIDSLGTII